MPVLPCTVLAQQAGRRPVLSRKEGPSTMVCGRCRVAMGDGMRAYAVFSRRECFLTRLGWVLCGVSELSLCLLKAARGSLRVS